jgi:hypothetical protein
MEMRKTLFMLLPAAIILTASRMCYYYYVLAHQSTSIAADSTNTATSMLSVIKHPRFIFGHLTGHAGSTSSHASLSKPGCLWETVNHFERMAPGEINWKGGDLDCNMTKNILIPELLTFIDKEANATGKSIDNTTFIDMGHWHNRGRVIECLADHFREQAAFVRIRRDRYSIANSFARQVQTPCMHGELRHSKVSICPRSGKDDRPVNLPVPSDHIWDAMTRFQNFLWYADKMEHRWYTLTTSEYGIDIDSTSNSSSSITTSSKQESQERGCSAFHEMTWNTAEELPK